VPSSFVIYILNPTLQQQIVAAQAADLLIVKTVTDALTLQGDTRCMPSRIPTRITWDISRKR